MAIYGYVRSASAADGATDAQKAEIFKFRESERLSVIEIFEDRCGGLSTPAERPGWSELMAKLQKGNILVVCDFDRISRDATDLMRTLWRLSNRGITVIQPNGERAAENDGERAVADSTIRLRETLLSQLDDDELIGELRRRKSVFLPNQYEWESIMQMLKPAFEAMKTMSTEEIQALRRKWRPAE
jgi:DNA invertase Pin-like site-specific DNA recombinase